MDGDHAKKYTLDIEPKPDVELKNKKSEYRLKLQKVASGCSVKGLSRSVASRRLKFKIWWCTLFVIGVVMFCYNVNKVVQHFRTEPVLTQFDRKQMDFEWPHLTLCDPTNPIPFWTSLDLKSKWKAVKDNFKTSYADNLPKYNGKKLWQHYVGMSTVDPRIFFQSGLNGTLQSVQVNYQQSSLVSSSGDFDQYKSVKNFEKSSITVMDSIRFPMGCYRLAPEKLSPQVGKSTGLISLKLYVVMDFESYKYFDIGYESRKLYLYIHNADSTIDKSAPFYITPGTDSHIKLNQRSQMRIKDCTEEHYIVEQYDLDLRTTHRFIGGYEDCRQHLSQTIFFDECGCYNPFLPIYKLNDKFPRVCTNMSEFNNTTLFRNVECLNKVLNFSSTDSSYDDILNQACDALRKKSCHEKSYSFSRDTNQWQVKMSSSREKLMRQNIRKLMPNAPYNVSSDFAHRNLAIIKLSWNKQPPEATFESFEYSPSQLISDIGGIAGLWLGLSLISVFELVEFLYILIKFVMAD